MFMISWTESDPHIHEILPNCLTNEENQVLYIIRLIKIVLP